MLPNKIVPPSKAGLEERKSTARDTQAIDDVEIAGR
jgi:hypothetical protein